MELAVWIGAIATLGLFVIGIAASISRPFRKLREELRGDIEAMRSEARSAHETIGTNIGGLRGELNELRGDLSGTKEMVSRLDERTAGIPDLREQISGLRGDLGAIESLR